MNLNKLFEMQKVLDVRIVNEKELEGQDLLEKKILALLVELGELANELPEVFKFWSNKKNNYEKALKEYVDGLHFILSIGLEMDYKDVSILKFTGISAEQNIVDAFQSVFECVSDLRFPGSRYKLAFSRFIELGEMLGFTWEQIEQAYYDKNKINLERQQNGY